MSAAEVVNAVRAHRFNFCDEDQLQEGLAAALTSKGLTVQREVRLSGQDRVDLLVDRIGVEVKIKGSWTAVARQLQRYAASDLIDELVLVTLRASHSASLPDEIGGKPLFVLWIGDEL